MWYEYGATRCYDTESVYGPLSVKLDHSLCVLYETGYRDSLTPGFWTQEETEREDVLFLNLTPKI